MAPVQIDLEAVGDVPAGEPAARDVDPGFFLHLARRRGLKRFFRPVERAGHRLPETRAQGALEQQDFELGGVDHHQHRDRQLELHASRNRSASMSTRSGSMNTAKNGLPWSAQNSAAAMSTSISTPRSSSGRNWKPSNTSTWPCASRQDRSVRQSSSASQFSPNQSGKPSSLAILRRSAVFSVMP